MRPFLFAKDFITSIDATASIKKVLQISTSHKFCNDCDSRYPRIGIHELALRNGAYSDEPQDSIGRLLTIRITYFLQDVIKRRRLCSIRLFQDFHCHFHSIVITCVHDAKRPCAAQALVAGSDEYGTMCVPASSVLRHVTP